MKKGLIAILLAVVAVGCQDDQIGYLEAENAQYTSKFWEVPRHSSITTIITDRDATYAEFSAKNEKLLADRTTAQAEFAEVDAQYRVYQAESNKWEGIYYDYIDGGHSEDEPEVVAAKAKFDEAYEKSEKYRREVYRPVADRLQGIKDELETIALDILHVEAEVYLKETNRLKGIIKNNIPWIGTAVEGILGTEPIFYELVSVKNDQGNAEKFKQYLTVLGGGRIQIDSKIDLPQGDYVLTIKALNEGNSYIMNDVITIKLK